MQAVVIRTVWPSGLRRWLQAPVRKGVGSNPTAVIMLTRSYRGIMIWPYAVCAVHTMAQLTAVGFEPTPLRTGALSQRLRPLGQTVMATTAVR